LMSREDEEKYVRHSSIGPLWAGNSMWYFVDVDDTKLFVIRPWWGTRMLVDVRHGKVKKLNEKLAAIMLAKERDSALDALRKGLKNRKKWEGGENHEAHRPVLRASYLVGKLHVKEAVPYLRELEDVDISCVSAATWRELTMRRIVHVSLRRLGAKPGPHPCTCVKIYDKDYGGYRYYETPTLDHLRVEGIAHLNRLVEGSLEMDITFSDEYIDGAVPGLSPKIMRRLKRGQFPVQAHVDLHGLTRQEAEERVKAFLLESRRGGLRCVLIVHGRGLNSPESFPVLKDSIPLWLNRGFARRIVLAFATARPYDGGTGAIYVLLRRR